jgi:hypothetical protein
VGNLSIKYTRYTIPKFIYASSNVKSGMDDVALASLYVTVTAKGVYNGFRCIILQKKLKK